MVSFEESLHDAEWLAWTSTRSPCVTVRQSRELEVLHKVTSRKVVELSWSLGLTITRSIVAVVEHPGTKELGIYKIVGSGYACHQGKAIWIVLNNTRSYTFVHTVGVSEYRGLQV